MARPKSKAPARRFHVSGQSVCTIGGKDYYLGKHDSPESLARYAVLIATYQAGGLSLPDDFSVHSIEDQALAMVNASHSGLVQSNQSNAPVLVSHVTAFYREHLKEKYAEKNQDR
ncbi:MAG: hypothetical protein ACF8AM_20075 [Rhodopirellula sp. JB055]|uniref:hypothetical protein n=1 Tax=Rhodopirellula sp. JB055 TaxID=3342846 RepID=UPI00370A8273